nr:MAG TPA: hypothetical protein [Caudoviricetes sp.]
MTLASFMTFACPMFHTSFLCSNNFVESRRILSKSLHFLDKCGIIKTSNL